MAPTMATPTLIDRIKEKQSSDKSLEKAKKKVLDGEISDYQVRMMAHFGSKPNYVFLTI
ncbi:UNVERIFIED_CONTAM: hypothetical protein ITH57_25425 [Salmonella enterica subsp. enterica serovar Weltevreden]